MSRRAQRRSALTGVVLTRMGMAMRAAVRRFPLSCVR